MSAEWRVLDDPDLYPSDEVIASHLGRAGAAFDAMREYNKAEHPDIGEAWKFYNDYKSWLCKASRKKKTLFWMSIGDGGFRATFYLGSKAGEVIEGSSLPEELKAQYRESEGKTFHGVTAVVKSKKDLDAYRMLLAIKLASG
jgi:hypothetical protein